jgi:hypothetical protein
VLLPANLIGAWVGVAFAAGAAGHTLAGGAVRGLVALLVAVAVYYTLIAVLGEGIRTIGATHAAVVWGSTAVIVGPLLGAAGQAWRRRTGWWRAMAVGPLSAALIAEGLVFGAERLAAVDRLAEDPGAIVLGLEIAVGAVLPLVLLPRGERLRSYAATLGLTIVGVATLATVDDIIRTIADTF